MEKVQDYFRSWDGWAVTTPLKSSAWKFILSMESRILSRLQEEKEYTETKSNFNFERFIKQEQQEDYYLNMKSIVQSRIYEAFKQANLDTFLPLIYGTDIYIYIKTVMILMTIKTTTCIIHFISITRPCHYFSKI